MGSAARRPRPDAHRHPQCLGRRSLPDRHAVHVHGQHGVELVDEHRRDDRHAHRQGRAAANTRSPSSSTRTPIISETVPYADLVLPDTTYLERHDCISLLDRPISHADGPGDAIRHPVVEPDRDVRPFQTVLLDLGARLGLPGMVDDDGNAKYRDYADYIVNHERSPGIGPLAGWRGADGESFGTRRAQSRPARALHRERRLLAARARRGAALLQDGEPRLSRFRRRDGLPAEGRADHLPALLGAAAALPARRARPRRGAAAGERARAARGSISIRCRSGTRRSRKPSIVDDAFPLHALTQRPMHMYHSWGSQNAWLRQITSQNRLFVHRATAARAGHRRRRLGVDREPARQGEGPDAPGRRRQPEHGVDLERHRQAARQPGC